MSLHVEKAMGELHWNKIIPHRETRDLLEDGQATYNTH